MLGDPTQLQQVVVNLSTNAAQAMDGRGTLEVALDTIESTIEVPAKESTRHHAVSADGRWLVTAQADNISVLQIPGWQVRHSIPVKSRDVAISSDGRLVAAASERAHLWDLTGSGHAGSARVATAR